MFLFLSPYLGCSATLTAGLGERVVGGVPGRMAEMTGLRPSAAGRPGTDTDTDGIEGAAGIWMAGDVPARRTVVAVFFDKVSAEAATAPADQALFNNKEDGLKLCAITKVITSGVNIRFNPFTALWMFIACPNTSPVRACI